MRLRAMAGVCGVLLAMGAFLVAAGAEAAISSSPKPFEVTKFSMQTTEAVKVPVNQGSVNAFSGFANVPYQFTQAGGHPQALTTKFEFASEELVTGGSEHVVAVVPTRDPKDIVTELPSGLLGNPQAVPRCPLTQILDHFEPCPTDTQIGVAVLHLYGYKELLGPIVNLTPEAGQSAEFGLENEANITYVLTAHVVRKGSGYGLSVVSNDIPLTELVSGELTFWGVPADPSHTPQRGLLCARADALSPTINCSGGGQPSGLAPVPFLTMPSDCAAGPERGTLLADSWEEQGRYVERAAEAPLPTVLTGPSTGFTGCNLLQFDPAVEALPNTLVADEPVGLGVNVKIPQVESPTASATPDLHNAVVTLPEGLSISPGIVDGIQACNESGPEGINFTGPESEEVGQNGELRLAPGHCPDASTVGEAEAETPLLGTPVKGHLYLARPSCGGAGQAACTEADALDGKLYQLYLELGGVGALADTGVNLKVHGIVKADPATGQLTTVFENPSQLPVSEIRVRLNGGPRASLDTPAACGRATTTADLAPWSAPGTTPEGALMAGTPDATPSSFFEVTGCTSPPALKPGFVAGTVTPQAGQFSSFTMNISRQDREQFVKGIQVHTPPGLLGMLSSVPLCGEPEANDGHCAEASKIGSTRVASGAGSHPFEIEGNVYLTGPYAGAPFGLSIVTHAVAGPFNLGLVVVRARIDVNPFTSTLTVTTDETGPHAIPQIIFGVPLRLKRITVDIDRPNFMFNPTDCAAQQIGATISGSENATAEVSSPFAVGGCKSLAFKPNFTVSTSAKTSRRMGASLDVKLSYPAGSMGSQANIASVKVDLPKRLPSRLTTLQKACPAATFDANPATCPAASVVGVVRASTPLLPVGLSGPVYFVSHGGEAFPSLIIVLQGDGVRVDLTGTTFISKAGITSSTFKTVPDVPVKTFELYLPEGKYSALAANGNLCKFASSLKMPTRFTAQNGAVIKQSTKIQVVGCNTKTGKAARTGKKGRRSK